MAGHLPAGRTYRCSLGILSGTGRPRKSFFASVQAMPPTAKENEVLSASPEAAQRPASATTLPSDMAIKQQPVALEVPVTINGARTVEGSDKREPFSETTKTVLVFGNGAVIRLTSSVAPGQLLFLTNEKTKKEVVCQVVKSKNYRNVSGYVELEFTESVVGFWGMRFPSDRLGGGQQPEAPSPAAVSSFLASGSPAIPQPVAPNVAASGANGNGTPSILAAKPAVPISVVKDAEPKLAEAKLSIPTAPKVAEPVPQKPAAPVAPLSSTLSATFDPEAPLYPPSTMPPPPVVPVAPVSAAPQFSVNPAPAKPVPPESALFDSPRASEAQASILEPAKTSGVPATASVSNLLSLFEVKSASPAIVPPPPAPPSAAPETEALKQHTARLQEQLSHMMFSGAAAAPAPATVQIPHAPPVVIQKELAQSAAKVLEASQIHTPEPAPAEPAKLEPRPAKSSLADEQLKIPAWLEPLARNASVPSSTQELIEREKARRLAEQPNDEETPAESLTEEYVSELPPPTFDEELPIEEEQSIEEGGSGSSSKGILIGAIAASVLLAGGGWWYMQRQSGGVHAGPVSASNVQASVASLPVASSPSQPQANALPQTNPPAQSNPAVLTNTSAQSSSAPLANTSAQSNSGPATLIAVRSGASAETAHNTQPSSNPTNTGARATTSAAEQPKKPVLGEVHLAKPKVSASRRAQNGGEPDAGIAFNNDAQPESGAEALNSGLAGGNKQPSAPAAPLPIGGDVRQAKLIFSVPPVYPPLAKSQHVSGNVLIDALIDANGHVTTMKVVSGPSLLHQAAMDALRQWKYQPASLDGKLVPMHLAVTIQFHLQ